MIGKTHKIAGLTVGVILGNIFFEDKSVLLNTSTLLISSYIGSIMPDVDHRGSTFSRYHLASPFVRIALITLTSGFGDEDYTKNIDGHRGFSHSIFMLYPYLVFSLLLYLLLFKIFRLPLLFLILGGSAGILSHIFLDSLNVKGIKLFAPLSDQSYSLAKLPIDGFRERILRFILAISLFLASMIYVYKILVVYGYAV